jgi:hypothetical protein
MESDRTLDRDQAAVPIGLETECCKIVLEYFLFVSTLCNELLIRRIDHGNFIRRIDEYCERKLSDLLPCMRNKEEIAMKYHRVSSETHFAIYLACFLLNVHKDVIKSIELKCLPEFIKYADTIHRCFESIALDGDILIENKVLIRSWIIKDLKLMKEFELEPLLDALIEYPPKKFMKRKLKLFKAIVKTQAIKEAVNLFIVETLNQSRNLFSTVEEGEEKVYRAFDWVIKGSHTYFAPLLACTNSISSESFIFVNLKYLCDDTLSLAMRILILIDECLRIYASLDKADNAYNCLSETSNMIDAENESSKYRKRFYGILFRSEQERLLLLGGAGFLIRSENWNTSLTDEFTERKLSDLPPCMRIREEIATTYHRELEYKFN